MCRENEHLPSIVQGSYNKLVAEKDNGGIIEQPMSELLDILANRSGAVEVLKQYVFGGMQKEAKLK